MPPLDARLSERAALAGVAIDASLRASLLAYFDVLVRWNRTINLTALSDPDEAIDRLLLEPVSAARHLQPHTGLADLGSGGGSPAIPLALALRSSSLLMVESKARKAAFLREAARSVGLPAVVETQRFEDLAAAGLYRGRFGLVTLRAVRMDVDALEVAASLVSPAGTIGLFVTTGTSPELPLGLQLDGRFPLLGTAELLRVISNVPRETLDS